jgi:hypothetical protein
MQEERPSMSKLDECFDNFIKDMYEKTYTYKELQEEVGKSTEEIRLEKIGLQKELIAANDKILELQNEKINK